MRFLFSQKQHTSPENQQGFTVIEFIVIMSIFAAIAAVALFNFRDFSDVTSLNNLAFDVALEIKRAQTIGSSSIDDTAGDHSAVTVGFTHNGGAFGDSFEVFRELGFGGTTGTGGIGILGLFETNSGDLSDRVSQLRGGTIQSIALCDPTCSQIGDDVTISFMRPRTEPIVLSQDCSGSVHPASGGINRCIGELQITVGTSARSKIIHVEPTGNIYVR